jgi:hypothetical protein
MKNTITIYRVTCLISLIAALVLAINVFISGFDSTQITSFICVAVVFCSNLILYSAHKKKDSEGKTKK